VFATLEAKWDAVVERIAQLHQRNVPVLVGTRSVRDSEHLSDMLTGRGLAHDVLNAVRHREEAEIVARAGQGGHITVATNMAGRGTDIKLGRGVEDIGGLHVIATERHEARRVDRQLFGRSGRQGDPGCAQAMVSLEDELLRQHAPRARAVLAGRYAGKAGEIRSPLARKVFALAQRRAQRLALQRRKGVLKSDDWLDEYLGFAGREH
jgi:preprotein translocase subunit SecA